MLIENKSSFTTSTLQSSLAEPANSSQTLTSTPISVTTSMPSSEAVSATSSNPDASVPCARKSTVAARQSRNYQGPYTQTASVSSYRPCSTPSHQSPSPPRHYSPPPRHHSSTHRVASRHYSPPDCPYTRRSPSPNYQCCSPSPPPSTLSSVRRRSIPNIPGVRIIQTQELHRIVQDMDTGISALVPVMQVSSSQMGLDLSALMRPSIPEGHVERLSAPGRAPCPIEGSCDTGNSRYHP